MSRRTRKFMRLIIFFDLPVTTSAYRRAYVQFRRFLLRDGYNMVQWSVYSRVVNGQDAVNKHLQRLRAILPKEGSIRCIQITEKQYANIQLLVGEKSYQEKRVTSDQLLLF